MVPKNPSNQSKAAFAIRLLHMQISLSLIICFISLLTQPKYANAIWAMLIHANGKPCPFTLEMLQGHGNYGFSGFGNKKNFRIQFFLSSTDDFYYGD
jgi:hypothetical protein